MDPQTYRTEKSITILLVVVWDQHRPASDLVSDIIGMTIWSILSRSKGEYKKETCSRTSHIVVPPWSPWSGAANEEDICSLADPPLLADSTTQYTSKAKIRRECAGIYEGNGARVRCMTLAGSSAVKMIGLVTRS